MKMKTSKLITTAAFVSLCFTASVFANEENKQPELTTQDASTLNQHVVGLEVEQILSELKQELTKSVNTQVNAALNTIVVTVKNAF